MKSYSVGIGITNKCNFNCSHCYSREGKQYNLNYSQIFDLIDKIPIRSINFGTGESILNPDFIPVFELLFDRNIKCSLTSNGYSIMNLTDEILKKFNDIDVSVDYGESWENDLFRSSGSFEVAMYAIRKLVDLGVEVSIASCMTNMNFSEFGRLFEIVKTLGINLRVNIYKPVYNKNLTLTYDQFWNGVKYLLSYGELIACSEPIVNTIIKDTRISLGCNCGKDSFRIRPCGDIVPCVYWGESNLPLQNISAQAIENDEQFQRIRKIPEFCHDCEDLAFCEGGCGARRYYNDLLLPDPYCYRYLGREEPKLKWSFAEKSADLVHANYLCTFILK